MSNKLIVVFILLLAIISPALTSNESGLKVAGFTEFVSNPVIHLAAAAPKEKNSPPSLHRNKNISRKAYLAGYKTLNKAARAKVRADLKEIRNAKKSAPKAKKVRPSNTKKTNAQRGALRQAGKRRGSRVSRLLQGLTADEKKTVFEAVRKINADRKAKRATRKASGTKKPAKKFTNKTTKKLSEAERTERFNKLDRKAQLDYIAKRVAKAQRSARALRRAIVGWKYVKKETRDDLVAKYPVRRRNNQSKGKKPNGNPRKPNPNAKKPKAN